MPSDLDDAPYLSICVNVNDNSAWVQLSRNEKSSPKWERFHTIEDAFEFIKTLELKSPD